MSGFHQAREHADQSGSAQPEHVAGGLAAGASHSRPRRRELRQTRRRRGVIGASVVALLALPGLAIGLTSTTSAAVTTYSPLEGADQSTAKVGLSRAALELGVRFTVTKASTVTALRFLKAPGDITSHKLTIWDGSGRQVATANTTAESASGWQQALLTKPLALTVGTEYTASYGARRYMVTPRFFTRDRTIGPVVLPAHAGVLGRVSSKPRRSYQDSNYWIDVIVASETTPSTTSPTSGPTTTTSTTATTTSAPTTSTSPATTTTTTTTTPASPTPTTSTTTSTSTPTSTPTTPTGTSTPPASEPGDLQLPRVPWEGGSAYYSKFPAARAAGWSKPSFFPFAVFYGKPEHAPKLHSLGINTYMGAEHDGSRMSTMTNAGISVIAQQSEWTPAEVGSDQSVVGWFISDECDMGYSCSGTTDQENLASQKQMVATARSRADGRFTQANFGNGVLDTWWARGTMSEFVNSVDVASVDKYAYTSPHVQSIIPQSPHWVAGGTAGSSATYGWLSDQLRNFGSNTSPHPSWVFVETARPYLDEAGSKVIKPEQIEGAVWAAVIHEARGIAYFQHSNDATCSGYSLVDCDQARQDAVRSVNAKVTALAPVINTQSFIWNFNSGTDTMLKTYQGDAYIFAGVGLAQKAGQKTFTLPAGVHGTTVTVVDENRTIPVTAGKFTDSFAAESSHHIYKVSIS